MKQPNSYCRALGMLFLALLGTDCKSSESFVEMTSLVPMLTSEVTSSDKHSLYGFTDKELKAIQFAKINWSNLTADMANGQGEHLSAIADLMAINPTQRPTFYAITQAKFSRLVPTSQTTPEQLVSRLRAEVNSLNKI